MPTPTPSNPQTKTQANPPPNDTQRAQKQTTHTNRVMFHVEQFR